jgi:hypothetical protein
MKRLRVAVSILGLALCATPAPAQSPVTLERPRAQIGFSFDGRWNDFEALAGGRSLRYWEWLGLDLRGAVIDPRLLRFSGGIRPGFRQTVSDGRLEEPEKNASVLAWNVGFELFANRPLSISAFTFRDRDVRQNRIGDQSQYDVTETSARLVYENRYFPLVARYRARSSRRVGSLTADNPLDATALREDISFRTIRVAAQNRKTSLWFEHQAHQDRISGTTLGKTDAALRHRLRWGKGSSIRSALEYLGFTGRANLQQFTWREMVHLQHTWSVFSDYEFLLRSFRDGGIPGAERLALVAVTVKPVARLQSRTRASWYGRDFSTSSTGMTRLLERMSYSTQLPLGGRFTAAASVEYNRFRFEPGDAIGWLSVVDERHVVDAGGRVALNNADVDAASVRVRRPDGSIVYQLGFDYQLLQDPPFTEVLALPTGRIAPDDTVLVDYRYQVLPESRSSQLVGSFDVRAGIGGLEVFSRGVRTAVRYDAAGGGTEGAPVQSRFTIQDLDETIFGLRVSRMLWSTQVEAGFQWSDRSRGLYAQRSTELHGALTMSPRRDVAVTLGITGLWGRSTNGPFQSASGGSSIRWMPLRTLLCHANLSLWRRRVGSDLQTFVGGGGGATWQPGLLEVQLQFTHDRMQGSTNQTIDRLAIYLSRRF